MLCHEVNPILKWQLNSRVPQALRQRAQWQQVFEELLRTTPGPVSMSTRLFAHPPIPVTESSVVASSWATVIHTVALLHAGTNISAEALHWALDTVMSRAFTSEEAGGWPRCYWLCVVAWTGTQMRVAAQTLAQSHAFDCNAAGPGQTALFKCVGVVAALFALSAMLGENGKLVCYCIMAGIILQV